MKTAGEVVFKVRGRSRRYRASPNGPEWSRMAGGLATLCGWERPTTAIGDQSARTKDRSWPAAACGDGGGRHPAATQPTEGARYNLRTPPKSQTSNTPSEVTWRVSVPAARRGLLGKG
jgi:hypothetical protein